MTIDASPVSFEPVSYESVPVRVRRWTLAIAYLLMPKRIRALPHLAWHVAADMARGGTRVPDQTRTALVPDSFGGVAWQPTAEDVLLAAQRGFFLHAHMGPLKWWTRRSRMVLFFDDFHIAKRLRREMRKAKYRVTFDEAFVDVMRACAEKRQYNMHALTWITPEIMRIYADLHRQGHAHSFEVWDHTGKLIGGGYGLSVGRVFVTESQFSRIPNTSKMGFAVLNHQLARWGYVLNDGKDFTPTIAAMGFRHIPRAELEAILAANTEVGRMGGPVGRWRADTDLVAISSWQPAPAQPRARAA